MRGLDLSTVERGECSEVLFPNTTRPAMHGMVVEARPGYVTVQNIALDGQGHVRDTLDDWVQITQSALELPQLRPGRIIMRPMPAWRRWCLDPNALRCFNTGEVAAIPAIPSGLTIDELVRYENCLFVLAGATSTIESPHAHFRSPFFDHMARAVVRQHVTVFELREGMALIREPLFVQNTYRHIVPEGAAFDKVAEGYLWTGGGTLLQLGDSVYGSPRYRLSENKHFAIETNVLVAAGLAAA